MRKPLNIVADAHIWSVEAAFSTLPDYHVRLRTLEAAEITHDAIVDADILITRSSTRVNADLLDDTRVRFAATATIGDDHYDKAYLKRQGIGWANAAGSSTASVIEYMLTALLSLHAGGHIRLLKTRIGIIGAGRIGGALADICTRLGIPTLLNDPPRVRSEGEEGFSTLDELLAHADVLSLHTPLIEKGEDRTVHLLDAQALKCFRGHGIINAGRGACLDNVSLLNWLNADSGRFAVLDCWENEPEVSAELLAHPQLVIATPHIAGHSLDGKAANTACAYNALCRWLGVTPDWSMQQELPFDDALRAIYCSTDPWNSLHAAATALYPIRKDDVALRATCGDQQAIARAFTDYRRHYPIRRAWAHAPLRLSGTDAGTVKLARAMGMKIV